MQISGVTVRQLFEAVDRADPSGNLILNRCSTDGHTRNGASKFQVTLRVQDSRGRFARRSHRGRRMVAACYHAHRAFMSALFQAEPTARIHSMYAAFDGAEDFERHHWKVGKVNKGSQMWPIDYDVACDCRGAPA